MRWGHIAAWYGCVSVLGVVPALAAAAPAVQQIVDQLAGNLVQTGLAEGVAVGVVTPGPAMNPVLQSFAYGIANAGTNNASTGAPVTTDTLFDIASISKVFTTNLLGQAVAAKQLTTSRKLGQFTAQLGTLPLATQQVTLLQLANFTGGFARQAPLCSVSVVPGCTPAKAPDETAYPMANFVQFFQNTEPTNYTVNPPVALAALPGPSQYSNFSIGLLGLLLATPNGPLNSGSVDAWYNLLSAQILTPLGMTNTYLRVPQSVPAASQAVGYTLAGGGASVVRGKIAAIGVARAGAAYSSAPGVSISGGGGSGAVATAQLLNGSVSGIAVQAGGAGYVPAPHFTFNPAIAGHQIQASAVIAGGQIVAVNVYGPGGSLAAAPTLTVAGGRLASGRDATLLAHVAGGKVSAVTVVDGGAGYLPPLTVSVGPGDGEMNPVSVWAPASTLYSSINDMTVFAAAALGSPVIGAVAVPPLLTAGFKAAETQSACLGGNSNLAYCPKKTGRVGMAWSVTLADTLNNMPQLVEKDGSVPGFSSEILLVPDRQIAVVVLANSQVTIPAVALAHQIAFQVMQVAPP